MDYLGSMYIDNEMDLDEKKKFVEKIHSDEGFYIETLDLLAQEELLRKEPVMPVSVVEKKWRPPVRGVLRRFITPACTAFAGGAAAALILFFSYQPPAAPLQCPNRFVLYEPGARQVELVGSFTGWRPVEMQPVGNSGYWSLNLQIASGEHRFAYILDGSRRIADPTVRVSEKDDFGGENSILSVGAHI